MQHEVLLRVAGGRTTNQIARALSISPTTVDTHVRNTLKRTGARTRIQAAYAALVEEPTPPVGDTVAGVFADQVPRDGFVVGHQSATGATAVTLDEIPDGVWSLGDAPLVVVDRVATRDEAARTLLAAARGASVAIELQTDDPVVRVELLDGLRRISTLVGRARTGVNGRSGARPGRVVRRGGATAARPARRRFERGEAGAALGFSSRTVHRRLQALQERLGLHSRGEVVSAYRRSVR